MKAALDSASRDMVTSVADCAKLAKTPAEKLDCKNNVDFKSYLANAQGKAKSAIKDSHVQKEYRKGQQKEILTTLKSCTIDTSSDAKRKKSKEDCQKEMRKVLENLGKKKVTTYDLEKFKRDAQASEVQELMKTCMKDAGKDKAKMKKCRDSRMEAMQATNPDGRPPSKKDLRDMEKRAGFRAVSDLDCQAEGLDKTACAKKMKEAIASCMGKGSDELTDEEVKRYRHKGAQFAGREAAMSCFRAKSDDATATCDDPVEQYLARSGKTKPSDKKKADTQAMRLKSKMAKDQMADARKMCFKKEDKAAVKTCLDEAKGETDGFFDHLLKDKLTGSLLTERKKRAQAESDLKAIVDDFADCMDAADDTAAKDACKAELAKVKDNAGIKLSDKAIKAAARAQRILEQKAACTDLTQAEKKKCLKAAKDLAMKLGMPAREFRVFQKFGLIKACAEEWSAAKDAGLSDADCDARAAEKYNELKGRSLSATLSEKAKSKIRAIGKAMNSGKELTTTYKNEVDVSSVTDGTACDTSMESKYAAKVQTAAGSGKTAKSNGCSVENGAAVYSASVPLAQGASDSEIATLCDKIQQGLNNANLAARRLFGQERGQERRLAAVTEAYAGQAVTQCAVGGTGDDECGAGSSTTAGASVSPKITGYVKMDTADCPALQTTAGREGVAKGIAEVAGASVSGTSCTVTCAATRRLQDRRLAMQTAKADYTILVPAGSGVTAATLTSNLNAASKTTFQAKIAAGLASKGVTANITVTTIGQPTATTTSNADVASSIPVRSGLIAILSLMASMAAGSHK